MRSPPLAGTVALAFVAVLVFFAVAAAPSHGELIEDQYRGLGCADHEAEEQGDHQCRFDDGGSAFASILHQSNTCGSS